MQISIRSNVKQVTRGLTRVQRKVIPGATVTALNKVRKEAATAAVKVLAKDMGLAQNKIKPAVSETKASLNDPVASIGFSGRALNLIRFNARQVKKGVSAKAWGKTRTYKGAFIANSGRTVFTRTTKKRLPIKPLYGPSIPKTFVEGTADKALADKVRDRFPILFKTAIKFMLSKLK